jgi:hypothetical protein
VRKLFALLALVAVALCISGANGYVAHASQDRGICQTWRADGDWSNWVSFDCYGWYHVTDVNAVGIGYCSSGDDFAMCDVENHSWTGGIAPHGCGDWGDITDNGASNSCLPGPYEGEAGSGSARTTVDCCPALVQLPGGQLAFHTSGGYKVVPGYSDAVNDGFTWCPGSNQWCGAALVPNLPDTYLGQDAGCNCGPGNDTVNTNQTCCPAFVELQSGDIYAYNSGSQSYDYISGGGADTSDFNIAAVEPDLTWCANTVNPWNSLVVGDWCGITFMNQLPARIGQKKPEHANPPVACNVTNKFFTPFKDALPGRNSLTASGTLGCTGGTGSYKFIGRVTIYRGVEGSAWAPVKSSSLVGPAYQFLEGQSKLLTATYICTGISPIVTVYWYAMFKGEVWQLDGNGNTVGEAEPVDSPSGIYPWYVGMAPSGGCY